jgi:hypothetical protein
MLRYILFLALLLADMFLMPAALARLLLRLVRLLLEPAALELALALPELAGSSASQTIF